MFTITDESAELPSKEAVAGAGLGLGLFVASADEGVEFVSANLGRPGCLFGGQGVGLNRHMTCVMRPEIHFLLFQR